MNLANSPNFSENVRASDINTNLEFVKYEDNIVYVRLMGACQECSMLDVTLKDGIEELLINEIPEIK